MINTMPVLTDEQRKELIADCKEEIERITTKVLPYCTPASDTANYCHRQIQRQQIALASLDAEPKAYAWDVPHFRGSNRIRTEMCAHNSDGAYALYTAPPVPVLKPIALPNIRIFCNSNKSCRRAGYAIAGAIRAAGYEVTE